LAISYRSADILGVLEDVWKLFPRILLTGSPTIGGLLSTSKTFSETPFRYWLIFQTNRIWCLILLERPSKNFKKHTPIHVNQLFVPEPAHDLDLEHTLSTLPPQLATSPAVQSYHGVKRIVTAGVKRTNLPPYLGYLAGAQVMAETNLEARKPFSKPLKPLIWCFEVCRVGREGVGTRAGRSYE